MTPQPEHAIAICERVLGASVEHINRFPTGLCHHVYDVILADGRAVVVRVASDETRHVLAGGIYWSGFLHPLGVPLPALLHADADAHPFGYMILERIPGTDLGNVYPTLSALKKRALAEALASIQARVATLPCGRGYGYVHSYNGPFPCRSWREVLDSQLARSRQWLTSAAIVEAEHARRVEERLSGYDDYFLTVAPTPFLEDITTKNVLVADGRLAGIVDVDELCFGDSLYVIALTRMALLARGLETDYIDYWTETMRPFPGKTEILDLYTAMHCVCFLGEIGQTFNRDVPGRVDPAEVDRLLNILDDLLAKLR